MTVTEKYTLPVSLFLPLCVCVCVCVCVQTEEQIEKAAKSGQPVAAIIIEPIQAEGGMCITLVQAVCVLWVSTAIACIAVSLYDAL